MIISVNKYGIVLIKKTLLQELRLLVSTRYCLEVSVPQVPALSQVKLQWSNCSHHQWMTEVFLPPKKEEEFHSNM